MKHYSFVHPALRADWSMVLSGTRRVGVKSIR